jgi:hypothetical protein
MAPAMCSIVVDVVCPSQPGTGFSVCAMCVADREIGLSQGLNGHSTRLIGSRLIVIFQRDGYLDLYEMSHQLLAAPGQAGH